MDGFSTPAQHIERLAELGYTAVGITEHGNVSSYVPFEKAAKGTDVKPVYGLEAYTAIGRKQRKYHLTLLAMNLTGYANLMKICTRSWAEGFHYYPTVSGEMLADHAEGIICLSGCADSLLSCSLLGGKAINDALKPEESDWEWNGFAGPSLKRAEYLASSFKELFGDRYYLECQQFPELDRTCTLNPTWERLGRKLGIGLAATADVHTIREEDKEMREVLHAAGRGTTVAKQMETWEYSVPSSYPTSDEELYDRLRKTGLSKNGATKAILNTGLISERCNVTLPKAERFRYPGTVKELEW